VPMTLPSTAHTAQPWRIHELAHDFRLEDVWALPTPGGPGDFPDLVRLFTPGSGTHQFPGATRLLFALRWKLGALLGWDKPDASIGARVPSQRDRLPPDLRDTPPGPDLGTSPFSSVYLTDNEWVTEIANRTVRGVRHLGWVPDGAGGYRGQMAVLVKPNGAFGKAYMAGIKPFRNLVVYPQLMQAWERRWQARTKGQA
jgi:hypothetical protein